MFNKKQLIIVKIHIIGASCAGSTTLGQALAKRLGWKHLDSDDYYWKKTEPAYQVKIPLENRNELITQDFLAEENVLLSGSMISWGKEWEQAFDLVVFLLLPPKIRLERLRKREYERYGDLLTTDPIRKANSEAFFEWATKYDDPNFDGRSVTSHRDWLEKVSCPVLEIAGDTSVEERVKLVLRNISH